MKNSKKLLVSTLGLMLGLSFLVGCGGGENPDNDTTYTVTFKHGNEEVHTETVKAGETCPEWPPETREGYTFKGWYKTRQHAEEDKFDFTTPINKDTILYSWYKADFKASTDVFYIVGSFAGGAWDGDASSVVPADRTLVHTVDEVNEKNIYEWTIPAISVGEKFRLIKATIPEDGIPEDGLKSDGWTDTYGYDLVSHIYDEDGTTELVKGTDVTEQDSKNIGVNFAAELKVTYIMESDHSANGEIILSIVERHKIAYPDYISIAGILGGQDCWENDNVDLTTTDDGATWSIEYTFAEGDVWKLRKDHSWAGDWGYGKIASAPEGAFSEGLNDQGQPNGEIVVNIAGTYKIDFDFVAGSMVITAVEGSDPVVPPTPTEETVSFDLTTAGIGATATANATISGFDYTSELFTISHAKGSSTNDLVAADGWSLRVYKSSYFDVIPVDEGTTIKSIALVFDSKYTKTADFTYEAFDAAGTVLATNGDVKTVGATYEDGSSLVLDTAAASLRIYASVAQMRITSITITYYAA